MCDSGAPKGTDEVNGVPTSVAHPASYPIYPPFVSNIFPGQTSFMTFPTYSNSMAPYLMNGGVSGMPVMGSGVDMTSVDFNKASYGGTGAEIKLDSLLSRQVNASTGSVPYATAVPYSMATPVPYSMAQYAYMCQQMATYQSKFYIILLNRYRIFNNVV